LATCWFGGHALAYATALETPTGVEISKMLPIPMIENDKCLEPRRFDETGFHRNLCRFSLEDYKDIAAIW